MPSSASRRTWPIIVGGSHRSGTSLIRRLLNSHSRIHCGPEVKFFRDFTGDYAHDALAHLRFFHTARTLAGEDELLAVTGRAFVDLHERAVIRAGKQRWADKNPENVLYVDLWRRLLGDELCFVHVVRPPLATIASMREVGFPLTIPSDLDGQIEHYRAYAEAGLAIGEPCLHISYDALALDPRAELRRLMCWLGEEPEDQQLDFNHFPHDRGLEDPKIAATTGVHTDSLERWRTVLDDEDVRRIETGTENVWVRLALAASVGG